MYFNIQIIKNYSFSELSRTYVLSYQFHLPFVHNPEAADNSHSPDKTACSLAVSHSHRYHILRTVAAAVVVGCYKRYLNLHNLGYYHSKAKYVVNTFIFFVLLIYTSLIIFELLYVKL